MGIKNIDGYLLRKAIIAGANELTKNKNYIDSMNVFPVPDGDTGTNMSLTVLAAAKEVEKLKTPDVHSVAKALSSGALRGARGNSGVILSQLFRGYAKGFANKELATNDDIADAFRQGMETAYKAVMKPKEGTILTIAKALSEKALELSLETDDVGELMRGVIAHGNKVLQQTPKMLPELRQAGVVDAGGKGLLCFLEAALQSYRSDKEFYVEDYPTTNESGASMQFAGSSDVDIKFVYCTEFFILVDKVTEEIEDDLKEYLDKIGDSIVVVGDEDVIKVHVHSNNPGLALERALKIGQLDGLKIENMRLQHTNKIDFIEQLTDTPDTPTERKDIGFVAISSGSGIADVFKNLGADKIIEGGQTMNPSAEDILIAVNEANADTVIVMPNNKNIILAAQQAAHLSEDVTVHVVPTKTIPQGISAMINFTPNMSIEENMNSMNDAVAQVKTGYVTYAARNTVFEGKDIKEGNILCMSEDKIEIVGEDIHESSKELLDKIVENGDFVTIFYGEEVSKEDAESLYNYASEKFPDSDIELYEGNQPLYYYIFSAE